MTEAIHSSEHTVEQVLSFKEDFIYTYCNQEKRADSTTSTLFRQLGINNQLAEWGDQWPRGEIKGKRTLAYLIL